MKYLIGGVATVVAGGFLAACAPPANESSEPVAQPAPQIQTRIENRLPVSLNDVMVAMVNQAADPIWVAAWREPETDADWRELERRSTQLVLAGTLLTVPGTGPMDDQWANDPAWVALAERLSTVGRDAVTAVRARNLEAISGVGDDIVEICEACHIAFKPDIPTGGQFGELSPTEADFEE